MEGHRPVFASLVPGADAAGNADDANSNAHGLSPNNLVMRVAKK
jgi:hypothetical protein